MGLTYHFEQGRRRNIPDVVKQISVVAKLANNHHGCFLRVLRNADAKLQDWVKQRCTTRVKHADSRSGQY